MSAQMIQTVGSALLHFFWQGAALAVLLLIGMSLTRSARARYALGVTTLALMALCPIVTLAVLAQSPAPNIPLAAAHDPIVAPAISNITIALDTAAPVTSFDLLSCLVCVWCSGVCLFAARAFGGWLILQKLRRTAQESLPAELLQRCRQLQQRIGIKSLVRYASSELVESPAVVGWFRPIVLLPLSVMSGLSVEQLDAIIAHELAHIRRYDALVNLFQIAVETVLFYHPAVWWVNRVIRTERENCCDDIAVNICGNVTEYARALAMLGDTRPTWAMAANGGALKARVGRLLGMQKMTHGIPRAGLAVLALLSASCVVLAAGVFKQDPPPPPPVPEPPPAAANVVEPPTPPEPPTAPELPPLKLAKVTRDTARLSSIANEVSVQVASAQNTSADQQPKDHTGPSYIDSLAAAGLTNLSVDELIALKTQGVTADYVREMKAAGFDASVHELIGLKVQGVSPEYIRDIRATGLKPTTHELMGMKVQGVTPEYIRAMQSAGLGDLKIHDIIGAKVQGVTPEFIEKVRAHGFKNLTLRQLIGLKIADVL